MNCHWIHPRQSLQAFLALTVLLIGSVADQSSRPVLADVGDANHIGLADSPDWITRNLVDGISIPVCSEVFPDATREAVNRWNDALRVVVFEAYKDHGDCEPKKRRTPQNGVLSTIVSKGDLINEDTRYTGSVLSVDCPNGNTSHGCAGMEVMGGMTQKQKIWRSFYGRAEVILNPTVYCRDINTPKSMLCRVDQSDYNLIEVIAHELGHILALPDYFCGRVGHKDYLAPGTRSLMNSWTVRYECNAIDGVPTTLDKKNYRSMYRPAAVVVKDRPDVDGQTVALEWDQSEVFAESDFEIQRWDEREEKWVAETTAKVNAVSKTLTYQPGGLQRYQVVARTLALCPEDADCRQMRKYVYGNPSNVVKVPVQLATPDVSPIRSSDITTNRVTLRWSEVPGANGYMVKRTDGSKETVAESLPGTARWHPFEGLSPNTPYTFYVQATLSSRSDLASAWAPAGATTKPAPLQLRVTPKRNSCESGESIDIDWEVEGGRSPYSVSFRDTNGNTTLVTFHSSVASGSGSVSCQSTPVTVTVTDAAAVPVSVNKTVSWTVTVPDITPTETETETFTLTAEISSYSCYITERVTVTWSTQNGSNDVTLTVSTRGTTVTFDYSDRTPSPITVYCRPTAGPQEIVVSAQDSTGASASSTFNVDVKEAQSLVECLPYTGYGGTAVYYRGSVCLGATASALWNGLASANIAVGCITKWDSSSGSWLAYQSGRADFNLGIRALLILGRSPCPSTSDVSGTSAEGPPACPDAAPAASGPRIARVGEASCVVVRGGGAAQVSDGSHAVGLTLPAGRDWALFASSGLEGDDAGIFWFLDLTTGGWIALNPADGAELARHAPADADGLPALLDAIAASASTPAAE